MDPRSFKIFAGEWVHLKHVSVMKCHNYSLLHTNWRFSYTYCTLSHSEFFTNISRGDSSILMHQKVAHISRLVFFLVFTVGVLLLSHPYLHGENNSPQSAFYID